MLVAKERQNAPFQIQAPLCGDAALPEAIAKQGDVTEGPGSKWALGMEKERWRKGWLGNSVAGSLCMACHTMEFSTASGLPQIKVKVLLLVQGLLTGFNMADRAN